MGKLCGTHNIHTKCSKMNVININDNGLFSDFLNVESKLNFLLSRFDYHSGKTVLNAYTSSVVPD